MRFLITIFWVVILVNMVGYVGSAMTQGAQYDFKLCSIIGLVVAALVFIVAEIMGKNSENA